MDDRLTEAIVIPDNTMIDRFKEIYDKGALLVIATINCEASTFIAKLKRLMQNEKYEAYRLETDSAYSIRVWKNE